MDLRYFDTLINFSRKLDAHLKDIHHSLSEPPSQPSTAALTTFTVNCESRTTSLRADLDAIEASISGKRSEIGGERIPSVAELVDAAEEAVGQLKRQHDFVKDWLAEYGYVGI
ncbi:hypothetical protein HK097_002183, partial [Rhizophlyctis rosea]